MPVSLHFSRACVLYKVCSYAFISLARVMTTELSVENGTFVGFQEHPDNFIADVWNITCTLVRVTGKKLWSAYDSSIMLAAGDRCRIQTRQELFSLLQEEAGRVVSDPLFQCGVCFAVCLPLILLCLGLWARCVLHGWRWLRAGFSARPAPVMPVNLFTFMSRDMQMAHEELSFICHYLPEAYIGVGDGSLYNVHRVRTAALAVLNRTEPPPRWAEFRARMAEKRRQHGVGRLDRFHVSQFTGLEIVELAALLAHA